MNQKLSIKCVIFILFALMFETNFYAKENSRGLTWSGPSLKSDKPFSLGNYRAVIIGNNTYNDKNKVWKDLSTAVNDAKTVANLLQTHYGFKDITFLENAGRKTILNAFKRLSKRVEPSDNVLIYYAGHGHIDKDEQRGYWIPTDGQGFDDTTFIRNSTIRDEINIIAEKTRHTLLVSDSCFSGSLLRGGNRGTTAVEPSQSYYSKVGSKKSVQVLTAGGKEYVDDNYRNSGHSPFTYFLLNELKTNNQKLVSLSEIATNIIKAVSNNVDQTPESGVLAGAGDELGEFIFARVSIDENVVEVFSGKNTSVDSFNEFVSDQSTSPTPQLPAFRF